MQRQRKENEMNEYFIKAEDLQSEDDFGNGWFEIEGNGSYPVTYGKERAPYNQVIDNDAISAIVVTGVPEEGLYIDKDHLSLDIKNETASAGWVRQLGILDQEGTYKLCALIEWTSIGLELGRGKIYKKFSTVYAPPKTLPKDGQYKPSQLIGLALTNRPAHPDHRPITNRDQSTEPQTTNPINNMEELKLIATQLGLEESATADEIIEAVKALQTTTDAAVEAEAEAILNSEGLEDITEDEKEMLVEELITNRARAMRVIKNRASAVKPKGASAPAVPRYAGNQHVIKNRSTTFGTSASSERAIAQEKSERALDLAAKAGIPYFTALAIVSKQA